MTNYIVVRDCLNCKITFKPNRSSFGIYCSNKCQKNYEFEQKYTLWLSGKINLLSTSRFLKKCIIRKNGYFCKNCGISEWRGKELTLELEHINGDSNNNTPDNLCLLCPNCHSQTSTFKSKNVGNGRHSRRLRYKEGKSY